MLLVQKSRGHSPTTGDLLYRGFIESAPFAALRRADQARTMQSRDIVTWELVVLVVGAQERRDLCRHRVIAEHTLHRRQECVLAVAPGAVEEDQHVLAYSAGQAVADEAL